MPPQRVLDPLHRFIEFRDSVQLERTLWKVIKTRPFQRLRRIKQLGFTDLVYPGASHSRFAHSLGVFHTARQLMQVVREKASGAGEATREETREWMAIAAALVHDLGHGPFSHAFEKVGKRLNLKLAIHENVSDQLIRTGEVAEVLNSMGRGFADDVAGIIKKEGKKTVHNAVVSSQFDADRLDYMRRDRLMTGVGHAAIDFEWLLANLDLAHVPIGVDERPLGTVETFVIGHKAILEAEAYVLGLFQLYQTVYFHKTTRGAEKLFTELLVRVVTLAIDGHGADSGLDDRHPLIRFARDPENIDIALNLDDTVVWGALSQMANARDPLTRDFSTRLRDRTLFKCFDIRSRISHALNPENLIDEDRVAQVDRCCASVNAKLVEWSSENSDPAPRVLIDEDVRSPYKSGAGLGGAAERINVRTDGGTLGDLKQHSRVVAALANFKLFRAYYDSNDEVARKAIDAIVTGEVDSCRVKTH